LYRFFLVIYTTINMKQGKPKAKSITLPNSADAKSLLRLKFSLSIIVALFAFVLYSQSIGHNYTLDDHPAIDENKVTTQGIAGIPTLLATDYWYGYKNEFRGPVYRPASLIVFAVAWQFFPDSPHILHFITVLMFALTCFFLFKVLCLMFKKFNLLLPFIGTLLYAAHPIHTEVVNTIKSMDEILCMFFGVLALFYMFKYLDGKSIIHLLFSTLCFYLSLISKETGITFLVIIPLTIYFFTDIPVKKNLQIFAIFVAITCIYLVLRMIILKDVSHNIVLTKNVLNNTLNAAPDYISQLATTFYIMLRYIFLLIFPHPLTCDYNFSQIKIHTLSDPIALLSIMFYIAIFIYAVLNFKKKSLISFSILFYLITIAPVSNLFFLNGSTMAERFLYIPSLGFCIILSYLLIKLTKTEAVKSKFKSLSQFISLNGLLFGLVFVIIGLYGLKTSSRNVYWKDNLTIFGEDIKTSSNSATANRIYGAELFEAVKHSTNKQHQLDTFQLAKHYLLRSLQIYPEIYASSTTLGNIYYIENRADSALYYYERDLAARRDNVDLNYNVGITLNKLDRNAEAIKVLLHTVALNPQHEDAYYYLAASYTNLNDFANGEKYFSKVVALNPKRAEAYYYLGLISKELGNLAKSKENLDKAAALGYPPK